MRQILPQCWFDEAKCADGIEALERYKYEWNPDLQVFSQKPEHSRCSHAADALRTFAVGYQAPDDDEATPARSADLYFNPLTYNLGFDPRGRG